MMNLGIFLSMYFIFTAINVKALIMKAPLIILCTFFNVKCLLGGGVDVSVIILISFLVLLSTGRLRSVTRLSIRVRRTSTRVLLETAYLPTHCFHWRQNTKPMVGLPLFIIIIFFYFCIRICFEWVCFFVSGSSVPAAGAAGYDRNSCLELRSQTTGAGFSDDEGSLSPPRHTYILEQCRGGSGNYINRINETYSDDEIGGFNSSDDAITYPNERHYRHNRRIGTHPQTTNRQQRHRSDNTPHTYTIYTPHSQHYCPDAL